jgi:hypothetical protein
MLGALLYLHRLKTRFPTATVSSSHRLFIAAFMIASKVICDDTDSNRSWSVVAQKMFGLKEINQMERELCAYLQWELSLQGDELSYFSARVKFECGSYVANTATSRSLGPIFLAVRNCTRCEDTRPAPTESTSPGNLQHSQRTTRPVPTALFITRGLPIILSLRLPCTLPSHSTSTSTSSTLLVTDILL